MEFSQTLNLEFILGLSLIIVFAYTIWFSVGYLISTIIEKYLYKYAPIQIPWKIKNRKTPIYNIQEDVSSFDDSTNFRITKYEIKRSYINDDYILALFPLNLLFGIRRYKVHNESFSLSLKDIENPDLVLRDYWELEYERAKYKVESEMSEYQKEQKRKQDILNKLNKEFKENVY